MVQCGVGCGVGWYGAVWGGVCVVWCSVGWGVCGVVQCGVGWDGVCGVGWCGVWVFMVYMYIHASICI